MTMFITQVLLRPQNLGNDKTDKVVQFLVGGVYNPKNLGNDKRAVQTTVSTTPKI